MYTGREQTFDRKIKEACLAIKLSDRWSKTKILADLPEHRLLRQPRLRCRGGGARRTSRAGRRTSTSPRRRCSPGCRRRRRSTTRSTTRRRRSSVAARCCGRCSRTSAITPRQYRWAMRQPLRLKPGEIYTRIKQPYFFTLRDRRARERLRREHRARGRPARLHDDRAEAPGATRTARSARRSTEPNDPAAAIVSVEPGTGAIRAMTAVIPGNTHNQFNLTSQSARQAGSTFKTFVLAAAIEKGIDPDTTYYTSAPFTCTTGPWCEDDYQAGKPWTVSTYDHTYAGTISVTSATLRSDNTVYAQLTLDVGPDDVWRHGQAARRPPDPEAGRLDRARRAFGLAARHGGGVRDVRRRRHLREAHGDPQGHPPEREDRQDAAGASRRPSACSRRASRGRSHQVLAENALYGTGAGSGDGTHPNAGKTGHDHRPRRRLVRRLHARLLDGGLDGLPARRDPDARRPRPGGRRRDVPGADLAPLHGAGREEPAGAAVPDADVLPDLRATSRRATGATSPSRSRPHPTTTTTTTTTTTAKAVPSTVPAEVNPGRGGPPPGAKPAASPAAAHDSSRDRRAAHDLRGARARARARRAAARRRRTCRSTRPPAACWPRPQRPPSTCRRSRPPRWTASRSAPPTRRRRCPSSRGSPPDGPWPRRSRPGEAMAIATGGVVPDGADSVVPIEDVEERDGRRGRARCGGDGRQRAPARRRPPRRRPVVVAAGTRLGPVHLGALAAAGVTHVRCSPATRGSSWRSPGQSCGRRARRSSAGEIYDANGVILATQIAQHGRRRSTGCRPWRTTPDATRAAVERGLAADVLVTSGGVSVGVYDLVRADRGRARRRGGLLARRRPARQAGRVRGPRPHARLRASRATRSPRSSASSCSCARRCLRSRALAEPRPALPPRAPRTSGQAASSRDSLLRARTRVEDGVGRARPAHRARSRT